MVSKVLWWAAGDGWREGGQEPSVHGAHGAAAAREPVHLDVLGQVVTSSKLLLTDWTLVGLHPRVGAPVPGQLI